MVQDGAFLPAVDVQRCALGVVEAEPHSLSSLGDDVQYLLQLLRVTGKEDEIVNIVQDAQFPSGAGSSMAFCHRLEEQLLLVKDTKVVTWPKGTGEK